jgi:hypothetical protein
MMLAVVTLVRDNCILSRGSFPALPARSHTGPGPHFQVDSFYDLQVADDVKEVVRSRIAFGPEHAHEAFDRYAGGFRQRAETDCRVDVVAQNRLARFDIAYEHGVNAFLEHGLPKVCVTPGALLQSDSESSCECHHVTFQCFRPM